MKKLTNDEYIERLRSKKTMIEPLEEYKGIHTKILHSCKKCGYIWEVAPNTISRGHGCPKCKGNYKKTTEEYNSEIDHKHIIAIEPYQGNKTPIKHKCLKCSHIWSTSPLSVLINNGCPNCYRKRRAEEIYRDQPTILYYIHIPKWDIYKIGISKDSVERRFFYSGIEYEVLWTKTFQDGYQAYSLEQEIIRSNQFNRWSPMNEEDKFIGWTECFSRDIKQSLRKLMV